VAAVNHVPLGGSRSSIALTVEGRPRPAPGEELSVRYRIVSHGYFDALEIPLLEGRAFAAADARRAVPLIRWYPEQPGPPLADAPQPMPVAVVSESLARAVWPAGAVGQRFRLIASPWITVVGVVADTRSDSLVAEVQPECYLLDLQEPASSMSVLLVGDQPDRLAPEVRRVVRALDPALPLGRVTTLSDLADATRGAPRLAVVLVAGFALAALVLMIGGVYSLFAFRTAARMPEMGLRIALGAAPASIVRLVLGQALTVTAAGTLAGIVASWWAATLFSSLLFEVQPADPLTLVAGAGLMLVVSLGAAAIPARRAARVDPLVAIRADA
jgi:hypothetical protein